MSFLLDAAKISNFTYKSAEQFLEEYSHQGPACLLVDIRMPGMNGLQLHDELKNKDIKIPVILMTGHGDRETAKNANNDGIFGFLDKPFDSEELFMLIRKCLDHSKKHNSLH